MLKVSFIFDFGFVGRYVLIEFVEFGIRDLQNCLSIVHELQTVNTDPGVILPRHKSIVNSIIQP